MININRKIQIGVMGSMADLNYSKQIVKSAEKIGYEIAKKGAVLVFGAEKDSDSLSSSASRGAKKGGGFTVGITYGKGLEVYEKSADVVIASGLERGGGRELSLVLSCDAIIALSGGSGTLTEIAIAYQANIPIIALENTGGWTQKLSGTYLDSRNRVKIISAKSPKQAVNIAFKLATARRIKKSQILFLAGVHGDEQVGIKALNELEQEGFNFAWMKGNKKAAARNKRFLDYDLNRIAPGNIKSRNYEIKRAAEIVKAFSQYEYVIDIHGTTSQSGIFTIVTNPTLNNLLLAACLPITNIVIWPSSQERNTGPLVSFAKCGVEIECGPKNSENIKTQLKNMLKSLLGNGFKLEQTDFSSKKTFKVYGKLEEKIKIKLYDFKEVSINGEAFYPLLVGQYKNIVCYKMKLINPFTQPFNLYE